MYTDWYGQFSCDTDCTFKCVHVHEGVATYIPAPDVSENPKVGLLCLEILEKCLESEYLFPMTFWLECMRCFAYDKYHEVVEKSVTYLFHQFLVYMLRFNDTYPLTLPPIFHSGVEMRKAAQFYKMKSDVLVLLIVRIYNTSLVIADPIESEPDTDACTDGDSEREDPASLDPLPDVHSYEAFLAALNDF